jgi:hypothetical protein
VFPAFGTPADGVETVTIELVLANQLGRPIEGAVVMLDVSGCGSVVSSLPATDARGRARATLASLAGEAKVVRAHTLSGGPATEFPPRPVEFLAIPERTYFVRSRGSDGNSGRSPLAAWGTLAHALASAEPGATVHVGAGVHAGPLVLERDSASEGPFVLAGDPAGRMTGDAGPVVIEGGAAEHALLVRNSRQVLVQDLILRGATAGLAVHGSSGVRVFGCQAFENEHGLDLEDSFDVAVQDCRIDRNRVVGVRAGGVRGFRFENNLVYANTGDGLLLRAGIEGGLVRFNTFYRNGGPHLSEPEPGGQGLVQGNLFVEGLAEALQLQAPSGYATGTNLAWANALRGPSREPPGLFEGDPALANPFGPDGILGGEGASDDDFRLAPTSAALDRADPLARAVVLASNESLALRSSRTDGQLDGTAPDLQAANLGFHPPTPDPAFVSVEEGAARLLLAAPDSVRVEPATWRRSAPQLTGPLTERVLEGDVEFVEVRVAPQATCEELWAAQVDTGAGGRILVRRWDGRAFDPPARSPFVGDVDAADLGEKRFDLEYESRSGRALFVWADGDGVPSFRVLAEGRWSPARDAWEASPGSGRTQWIELVPRPGSDEFALVSLDGERDLVVSLWDGTRFGDPLRLEANTLVRRSWRPFDAAFESLSGDLLVTWGFSVFAEEVRWATLERASGQWRFGQHVSIDASGADVVLAADPGTDRIVGAFAEGDLDNDVSVSVWTGSEWVDSAELTLAGPLENRLLEAFWFGDTGLAGVAFRRQGHTGSFNLALLRPTGWRIQPDVVLSGPQGTPGKAAKVILERVPGRAHLLGMMLDVEGRLFGLHHNGQRFVLLDDGEPLAVGLDPTAPGRSFDLALSAMSSRSLED